MGFLSTDNCSAVYCYQCFRSSLGIVKVGEPGNAGLQRTEMGESNVGRNSECARLVASEHNVAADEVSYTDDYESMAMSEIPRFDDAMTLMDYKVMVVLLFASPADH